MPHQPFASSILFCSGVVLICSAETKAQSTVTLQHEVVAGTSTPVPGIPGAVFGNTIGMDPPALADDGRVLFQSQFFGGGAQSGVSDRALFLGDKGALSKILRWGDPEPSATIPGATITRIFDNYTVSATGTVLLAGRLSGPGVTFSSDDVFYARTSTGYQLLAREGGAAPGSPAGTFFASNNFETGFVLAASPSGHVAFTSAVSGAINGNAVFAGLPGALQRVMSADEVVGPNLTVFSVPTTIQINASGQVLLDRVEYKAVTIGSQQIVGPDNNIGVWIHTPGVGRQQILREGDPSPITGAMYSDFQIAIGAGSGRKCGFNASGQALLISGLVNIGSSTAVTFDVNDIVLIRSSASGNTLVARRGDPVSGLPGVTLNLLNAAVDLRLNDSGTVAFPTRIAGAGVTGANDSAIFVGAPGNVALVVREGAVVPGSGGIVLGDLLGAALHLNGAGQVLFQTTGQLGASTVVVLCSWDPVAGLQLVAQQNDSIEIAPGNLQSVGSPALYQYSNGDSRTMTFADDGTVAMRAGIGNTPGMILKTRVGGTLTGFPKTISATTGGVHKMFLNASPAAAGKTYLFLGSATGTSPGFFVGSLFVPLNVDAYTMLVLSNPNVPPFGNTLGTLDASGRAVATLTIPAAIPGLVGLTLNHAYGTLNLLGSALSFVSEPARLELVP